MKTLLDPFGNQKENPLSPYGGGLGWGLMALLFVCILFSGCGPRQVKVTGRITFPDGQPLALGAIVFESEIRQATGYIDPEGNYALGGLEPGDGIVPGEYKIKILATTGGDSSGAPLVRYVHPKYGSSFTSGLSCTVKGKMTHDITVEKP